MMVELVKAEGVEVIVIGENWDAANSEAQKFLGQYPISIPQPRNCIFLAKFSGNIGRNSFLTSIASQKIFRPYFQKPLKTVETAKTFKTTKNH